MTAPQRNAVLTAAIAGSVTLAGFPIARIGQGLIRGEQWARVAASVLLVVISTWLLVLSDEGTRVGGAIGPAVAAAVT